MSHKSFKPRYLRVAIRSKNVLSISSISINIYKSSELEIVKLVQEYIPVGCVSESAWSWGVGLPGRGGVVLPGPGGSAWSQGGFSGDPHPPVNRITDTCKNITLATTSLRPVKNRRDHQYNFTLGQIIV